MHPMVNPTITTLLLCEWMSVPALRLLAACSTRVPRLLLLPLCEFKRAMPLAPSQWDHRLHSTQWHLRSRVYPS